MKRLLSFFIVFLLSIPLHASAAVVPNIFDKIDQMIMIGFRGTSINKGSDIEGIVKYTNVGGVILFDYDSGTKTYGRNIKNVAQVKSLTSTLQNSAKTPLFIAIDEEGGKVSRLKFVPGFSPLPTASQMTSLPVQNIENLSKGLGTTIKSLGINTNFAPVLDLTSTNALAPMTKQLRTFSSDPKVVANYAGAFIKEMNASSIATSGKHFPGLGEAMLDSHLTLPTIRSKDDKHLEPYKLLNSQGLLESVMVAHLIDTRVDPSLPASLSDKHMKILRQDIGFKGVVITDDLDMKAIKDKYSTGNATVRAIKAGADMVIISNNISGYNKNAFYEARNAILMAIGSGEISPARIEESYQRITTLKQKHGIIK